MANKTFVSNGTFTVADNDAVAFGASVAGTEIVKIQSGVTGVKLDANFERVILTEAVANYRFLVTAGVGFKILASDGVTVIATIPNINQDVKITFGNGSATLKQSGGTAFALIKASDSTKISGANVPLSPASVLSVALSDIDATATLTDTVAQFTATLNDIAVDDSVTIADTISHINTDLALGANSVLLNNMVKIDNFTIAAGAIAATDITAIDSVNGSATITGTAITSLTGTATQIVSAITALGSEPTAWSATLTGAQAAADVETIKGYSNETLTATGITSLTGTATQIVSAITALGSEPTAWSATLTGAQAAADVATIKGYSNETLTATGITSLTGTATQIVSAITALGSEPTAWSATLTGAQAAADVATIGSYSNKTLTATGITSVTGTSSGDTIDLTAPGVTWAASAMISINGGAGADTLTGRAAVADTFVFAAGDAGTISNTVFDTITNFVKANGTGPDILDLVGSADAETNGSAINVSTATTDLALDGLGGASAVTAAIASGVITLGGADAANIDTLAEWLTVAQTVVTTNGKVGAFEFSGSTYVYQENTGSNTDLLIKLTGVTGVDALATSGTGANDLLIVSLRSYASIQIER
jgi:hypothetical protein